MNRYTCLCHGVGTGQVCARKDCKRKPRLKVVAVHSYLLCAECWDVAVRKGYTDDVSGEWTTKEGDSGTAGQQ